MRDPSVGGKLGTKAQRGKHLIAVVVLDDLPDGAQGHGVVVQLVRAHVVERGGLGRVAWKPGGKTQVSINVYLSLFPSGCESC